MSLYWTENVHWCHEMQKPVQFKLMLPPDVKAWLDIEAQRNLRSQGAEIVACLRKQMEQEAAV